MDHVQENIDKGAKITKQMQRINNWGF